MRKLLIPIAVVSIALLGWWLWPRDGTGAAIEFTTQPVERGEIVRIVSSVGSVRALNTVEVGSQLSGQVIELLADFNTPVEAGDLLARLDPQTFERRVQEAEANLAVARANVSIQAAGIEKARANLANARAEFERQQALVERGSVSASALDNAEAAFLSAQADLSIAEAQHQNALATVQQREASLEAARIDLDRTAIRAPIDGVVIDRAVDIGQTVAASLQAPILFSIAQDLGEIQIEASVDEADIGSVRGGAAAEFTVDAFPGETFQAEVGQVRLAPNEEQNVVTYTVVINADNPDRKLLPGMTASIDIVTGRREDALRASNAAVRFRPPEDLMPESANETGGGPGGGARGNPGEAMNRMLVEVGVDEATREVVAEELREGFRGMVGLFQSGADRETIRERVTAMTREVLVRNLTAEQVEQIEEIQRQRDATRAGTVYTVNPDDSLTAHPVRLGISDDRFTEIVIGDLEPGMELVTRIRRTEPDA
ncbi:efflux RND transporter periplasmic adaptor subunit [Wenzhouxiangella sp. XN79A]|uniref:efflux RND transporter periplasmic adaptor subunit n=1 Tax=Wenzhouxiangella sp. XN79A TaxID=2724193 RepID=UPI00144A826A|nr:efflux RND transporter periplasmic adaptor subunit [Wenzhouxiangella sp. XN79A]NKI33984.1 efflux RND transporter periplasmic adaptor subunit [Wenzhouxiangella sp. XN79A]